MQRGRGSVQLVWERAPEAEAFPDALFRCCDTNSRRTS